MGRRSVAGLGLLAVLFAGCTGHGDPTASPTPSATATASSPTASPSRTGPLTTGPGVRPGETPPVEDHFAKQHDSSGALAFVTYYYRALDWSLATSDPYLLKQVSAPTCQACSSYVRHIGDLEAMGGHVDGGRVRLAATAIATGQTAVKADFVVRAEIVQQPLKLVYPSGAPSTVSETVDRTTSFVYIAWTADGWRVQGEFGP